MFSLSDATSLSGEEDRQQPHCKGAHGSISGDLCSSCFQITWRDLHSSCFHSRRTRLPPDLLQDLLSPVRILSTTRSRMMIQMAPQENEKGWMKTSLISNIRARLDTDPPRMPPISPSKLRMKTTQRRNIFLLGRPRRLKKARTWTRSPAEIQTRMSLRRPAPLLSARETREKRSSP